MNQNLSVLWINSIYDEYNYFSQLEVTEKFIFSNTPLKNWFLVTFPSSYFRQSVKKRSYFYFSFQIYSNNITAFLKVQRITKLYPKGTEKISWEKALKLCEHYGGTLPYFVSRGELDEFIALMKLSKYFPPFEAFYIGIRQKLVSISLL